MGRTHEAAVRSTATQAAEIYGVAWRGSLYVNYVFLRGIRSHVYECLYTLTDEPPRSTRPGGELAKPGIGAQARGWTDSDRRRSHRHAEAGICRSGLATSRDMP